MENIIENTILKALAEHLHFKSFLVTDPASVCLTSSLILHFTCLPDKYSPDLSKLVPSVETSNGIQPVSYSKGETQWGRPSASINPSRMSSPLNLQRTERFPDNLIQQELHWYVISMLWAVHFQTWQTCTPAEKLSMGLKDQIEDPESSSTQHGAGVRWYLQTGLVVVCTTVQQRSTGCMAGAFLQYVSTLPPACLTLCRK